MSTYNPLFSDNFQRANENPLNPVTWTNIIGNPLAVNNNLCVVGTSGSAIGKESPIIAGSWPARQYLKCTIASFIESAGPVTTEVRLYTTETPSNAFAGYWGGVILFGGPPTVSLNLTYPDFSGVNLGTAVLDNPPVPGDTMRLEIDCIANTQKLFYNDVLLLSANDTTYSALAAPNLMLINNSTDNVALSYYEAGELVPEPTIAGPFLGSVVISTDPDDDSAFPFIGSVSIVSAPVGNASALPFLGRVKLVSGKPGNGYPPIGQVVVLDSAPDSNPEGYPYLGTVQEL